MRYFRQFVSLLQAAVLLALCGPLRGEIFVLKSGGRVEGELLNPQREPGALYQLRTDEGLRLALGEAQVHRVIVKSDAEKEYEAALLATGNTVEEQWAMAEWCKDVGLLAQRKRHLAEVIRLEPDHKEARAALGYSLFAGKWMTQDDYMTGRGYVRYKGGWTTRQQMEIDIREDKQEVDAKDWRKQIRIWLDQLGTKRHELATAGLAQIRDVTAVPALAEILADRDQPRANRIICLEILGKLPPGLASGALVKLAMDERDEDLRDRVLDELIRQGPHTVLGALLRELKNERETPFSKNARINRAAYCLQRLGDTDATLPLIEALVTDHYVIVDPSAGGGGGMPINFNAGGPVGPGGQGGLGGLSMGGKPKKVKGQVKNQYVLGALTSMYPGVNYLYDVAEWKRWYIDTQTSTHIDLRRDE
ncbi:MAG TPA: hypothetical protein VFV87_15720 [Pirellulaceae bacterium]|nr:hypothetical protein [Pirellulaceae bacterium]